MPSMKTVSLALLAGLVLTGAAPLLANPQPPEIPQTALDAGVLTRYETPIRQYVQGVTGLIIDAETDVQTMQARELLVVGYRRYDSAAYRRIYAQAAAQAISQGLLRLDSPVKQINAALALRNMPDPAIQPAIHEMVAHPNPAVQYIGWLTYNEVKGDILAMGTGPSQQMLSALRDRLPQEDNPLLLAAMHEVARIQRTRPAILDTTLQGARRAAAEILARTWDRRCSQILQGDAAMIHAVTRGVMAWRANGRELLNTPNGRQMANQMIVNAMYAADEVYRQAPPGGQTRAAAADLLLEAEATLRDFTGGNATRIEAALALRDESERSTALRLAVLDWITSLQEIGVQRPNIQPIQPVQPPPPAATAATEQP